MLWALGGAAAKRLFAAEPRLKKGGSEFLLQALATVALYFPSAASEPVLARTVLLGGDVLWIRMKIRGNWNAKSNKRVRIASTSD